MRNYAREENNTQELKALTLVFLKDILPRKYLSPDAGCGYSMCSIILYVLHGLCDCLDMEAGPVGGEVLA